MTHLKNLFEGIQNISGDRHQLWLKLSPASISVASNYHLPFSLPSKRQQGLLLHKIHVSPNQCLKNTAHSTVQEVICVGTCCIPPPTWMSSFTSLIWEFKTWVVTHCKLYVCWMQRNRRSSCVKMGSNYAGSSTTIQTTFCLIKEAAGGKKKSVKAV